MNSKNEDFIAFTGDTGDLDVLLNDYKLSESALRFPNVNSILIPKKAQHNLRKYCRVILKTVDSDIDIAVEKCLVFLSNLASTYYTDSKFIEVDDSYQKGVQSKKYRLTDTYLKAGLVEYLIQDTGIIRTRNKLYYQQLHEAFKNPICSNLITMYQKIDLPTIQELLAMGKKLVKEGHTTKKGKILTMRNKHLNDYWIDADNRSFVEDNIKLFEFLTGRGFMIPSAGDISNGGRVVDSFTLMPSWIREQITVEGKKLVECDYRALHPNIAISLYKGKASFLTHENVAEQAGIDLKQVKQLHLSFFNMKWNQMRNSPLFDYYSKNEPDMLARIYHDKREHGHKITSQKMFEVEVTIMTNVIKHLNSKGIYVLYVYDALLCEEKDFNLVAETMDGIILEHGIKTSIKNMDTNFSITTQEVEVVSDLKYSLDEIVNLYDLLPSLSMGVDDTIKIISGIDSCNVAMAELVKYISKQITQQKYNDYDGVEITSFTISQLKNLIKP